MVSPSLFPTSEQLVIAFSISDSSANLIFSNSLTALKKLVFPTIVPNGFSAMSSFDQTEGRSLSMLCTDKKPRAAGKADGICRLGGVYLSHRRGAIEKNLRMHLTFVCEKL